MKVYGLGLRGDSGEGGGLRLWRPCGLAFGEERGLGLGGGVGGGRLKRGADGCRACTIPSLSEAPPSARSNVWNCGTRTVRTPKSMESAKDGIFSVDGFIDGSSPGLDPGWVAWRFPDRGKMGARRAFRGVGLFRGRLSLPAGRLTHPYFTICSRQQSYYILCAVPNFPAKMFVECNNDCVKIYKNRNFALVNSPLRGDIIQKLHYRIREGTGRS